MSRIVALLAVLALLAACSKPAEESEAKQWPKLPTGTNVQIRSDLSIAVTVDGATKPAITGDLLKSTRPDFVDADRKAWRIPTLIGPVA